MKIVAIIPARGGSKRIPRKNIKDFAGQPIIKYSIDAALQSGIFDEVMVSTDDQEIAEIARSLGAKVPFMRSAENSSDMAMTAPVLEEVVMEYRKRGEQFEYVCCIYPTSPFITAEKLKTAKKMLLESGADSVLPIMAFSYPIQRGLKIDEKGFAVMIHPENFPKRSQDLMPAYHDCGQFYFMKTESMLKQKKHHPDDALPMMIPESEAQDIDNEEDWKVAEIKFKLLRRK